MVIWYDLNGEVLAIGAEGPPQPEDVELKDDEDDGWEDITNVFKVEWYPSLFVMLLSFRF